MQAEDELANQQAQRWAGLTERRTAAEATLQANMQHLNDLRLKSGLQGKINEHLIDLVRDDLTRWSDEREKVERFRTVLIQQGWSSTIPRRLQRDPATLPFRTRLYGPAGSRDTGVGLKGVRKALMHGRRKFVRKKQGLPRSLHPDRQTCGRNWTQSKRASKRSIRYRFGISSNFTPNTDWRLQNWIAPTLRQKIAPAGCQRGATFRNGPRSESR